jgi:hypothetical protein
MPFPDLFYAALELRCGVQSRLEEYLEAHRQIAAKKKTGWRIPELARDFERISRVGDKVARLTIQRSGAADLVVYFTPVTKRLQAMAGRLGALLHAQDSHADDDPWRAATRSFVEQVYEELRSANVGTLMGPPLLNRKTGQLSLVLSMARKDDALAYKQMLGTPGDPLTLQIKYLETLPPELKRATAEEGKR